jgi:hypothetical protein
MQFRFLFLSVSLLVSLFFGLSLSGCTLYQSSGREAIEKDSGQIVTSSGFSPNFKSYYNCMSSDKMPDFLKQDLEILNTKNEPEFVTVLASEKNSPSWIYVYTYKEMSGFHYSCQVYKMDHVELTTEDLVNVGVFEINNLNNRQVKQ